MILNHKMRIYEESTTRTENEYGKKVRSVKTATIAEIVCNVQDETSGKAHQRASGIDAHDRTIVYTKLEPNILPLVKVGTYVSFDAPPKYTHNTLFIIKNTFPLYSNHYEIECTFEKQNMNTT